MDRHVTLAAQQESHQPALDAGFVRSLPQLGAPAGNFACRYAVNRTADVLAERGTQLAFRADEPDQQSATSRVHLMGGVGPDPGRTTSPPSFLRPVAHSEYPAHCQEQLNAVMAV